MVLWAFGCGSQGGWLSKCYGLMKMPLLDYLLQPKPLYLHPWFIRSKYPLIISFVGEQWWMVWNSTCSDLEMKGSKTNSTMGGLMSTMWKPYFFSPDGKIRCSYCNAPGVLHDSTMAIWSSIYDQIEMAYRDTGIKVVVDSAFASKNQMQCWNPMEIMWMQMVILDKNLYNMYCFF